MSDFENRMRNLALMQQERAVEKANAELRAAEALAEREALTREFVFEMMAQECGRDVAMRALSRIRLLAAPDGPGRIVPSGLPHKEGT